MQTRTLAATAGLILAAGLCLGVDAQSPTRRYFTPRSAADANAATQPPFSGAVLAGDTLYVSGMLGTGDTASAAATNVLTSVRNALQSAGMTMDDLVWVQIFCSDVSYYNDFNTVYRTFFTKEYPARAFLGAGTILNNAKFEVMGIAVKR